jgi:hypothetical protein
MTAAGPKSFIRTSSMRDSLLASAAACVKPVSRVELLAGRGAAPGTADFAGSRLPTFWFCRRQK